MQFSRKDATNSKQLLIKLALIAFVGFGLFIAGAIVALAPQFVARLLPIPLLLIMVFMAFLSKSDRPLNENFLKVWLAVILATMALWPTYMFIKVAGLPSIDARKIVAGLSFAAMIYFVVSRKPVSRALFSENTGPLRVGSFLVFAYALWRIASCFVSPSPVSSLIQVSWEVLYYYSMFFVGALFFSHRNLHEWGMKIFMALSILISIYAGIEWLMQKNLLLKLAPTNAEFAEYQTALSISRVRDGFFRAQGTFEHPLLLAEFSAMAACFGLAAWLWPHTKKSFRVLGAVTFVAAITTALFTGSRSAFITLAAGAGFVFLLWFFSPKGNVKPKDQSFRKIGFVMTLITVLMIALPSATLLTQGKSRDQAASTAGRIVMMEQGIPSIQKYPVLGRGPGVGSYVAGIKTGSGLNTLDNYYLAIAIESGLPAILLLFAILLYPVWVIFNRLMTFNNASSSFYATVAGCSLVILLTHAVLWMPFNMTFSFLFSGAALAALPKQHKERIVGALSADELMGRSV